MATEKNTELKDLLMDEMGDLLHAENQLVKALPKMSKASHSPQLRDAFHEHLEQTKGHVERLQQAFKLLDSKSKAKTCKGMQGLIEEGEETIQESKDMDEASADLALIIAAQKVEHYEISGYGSLKTLAEQIGEPGVARLLEQTQREEKQADGRLTQISQPLLAKAA